MTANQKSLRSPGARWSVAFAGTFAVLVLISLLGAQGARVGPWLVPELPVWFLVVSAFVLLVLERGAQPLKGRVALAVSGIALTLACIGLQSWRGSLLETQSLTARVFRPSRGDGRPEGVAAVDTVRLPSRRYINRLAGRRRDVGLVIATFLNVPRAGTYRFELDADDRATLIIDERTVIENAGSLVAEVELSEGRHRFRLRYVQEGGPAHLMLTWDRPGVIELLPLEAFLGERATASSASEAALAAATLLLSLVSFAFALIALRVLQAYRSIVGGPNKAGQSKRLRYAKIAAVQLGQILVLVAAAELAASMFSSRPPDWKIDHFRLNHAWRPNSERTMRALARNNPEFPEPYVQRFNAQGWVESYDVELEKPPDVYRIFYLGDSFIEGPAPMSQNVPSLVEKALAERYADRGKRFEVINTGTTSYSPVIYYILLRYYLLPYEPDLVVLAVDMTDDYDDHIYRESLIRDSEGNPWAVPPNDVSQRVYIDTEYGFRRASFLTRVSLFLYQHSYAYNFVRDRVAVSAETQERLEALARDDADSLKREGVYPRWSWVQHEWDEVTERNVAFTLEMVGKIARLCQKNGIAFVVTGVPHYPQYAAGDQKPVWSRRPHNELEKVAGRTGAAYFDSHEKLRSAIEGTEQHVYYYRRDMHFNPHGLALWANAHIKYLTSRSEELLFR